MNRSVLERPFEAEVVKTRRGAFGDVSYVEGALYVRRLQEAFDGSWSWRIDRFEVRDSDVVVLGVLEAGGTTKFAFGGSAITVNKTTGAVVSIADDLKAAATDALKKACSLLGVGLELHSAATTSHAGSSGAPTLRAVPTHSLRDRPDGGAGSPTSTERSRLTQKQLRAIYAIGRASGLSDRELKARCIDAHGVAPEFLTKADASALIDELGDDR